MHNHKIALAVTLALTSLSVAAQSDSRGVDIRMSSGTTVSTAGAVKKPAPATVVAPSLDAFMPTNATKTTVSVTTAPEASKPRVVAKVEEEAPAAKVQVTKTRVETRKEEPARPSMQAAPAMQPVVVTQRETTSTKSTTTVSAASTKPADVRVPINPFSGKGLTLEQRTRELEDAKMDTDLIQEKLKQATLLADLTYLPLKKKSEIGTLPGIKDGTLLPTAKTAAASSAGDPEKTVSIAKKAASGKHVKKVAQQAPPTPAPPMPMAMPASPAVTVAGVMINGTKASAILETDNGAMSAQNGESTPYGLLRVIDSHTVTLGGRTLKVRETVLARMAVSDPATDAAKPGGNSPATGTPLPTPAKNQTVLPPLPPLPPLPKGMMSGR